MKTSPFFPRKRLQLLNIAIFENSHTLLIYISRGKSVYQKGTSKEKKTYNSTLFYYLCGKFQNTSQ